MAGPLAADRRCPAGLPVLTVVFRDRGIAAEGVGFRHAGADRPALADVSFRLDPGQCLLVLGPSGSGKSTLALALAGLVPVDVPGEWTGRLRVGGLDVGPAVGPAARREVAARVGLVFQDPESQLVMDRVEDDVAFGLENRGWSPARMRVAVDESLAATGLGGLERRRPSTLSGGQQQRLALAGILAAAPGVVVLDEPTANLDPVAAARFVDRLAALRAAGTTIVLVEHRVELAWPLADRLLVLGRDGRPLDEGPPDAVVARSGERLVREGVWLPAAIEARIRGSEPPGPAPLGVPPQARPAALDAADPAPLVRAERVAFAWRSDEPAIDGLDLDVAAGERVALLGPNGSGKTTLGRLLAGLLRPSAGRVVLDRQDPSRLPAAALARLAGFVFQDPEHQFLASTVAEEVVLGLAPDEAAAAPELLERLDLPLGRFGGRSPYALSGGEQRRLSVACILVRRPRLLVLDEPTFGQDRLGHEALVGIVRERVEAGTAVVAATHDLAFAAAALDRAVVLERGRAVADEPLPALLADPRRLADLGLAPAVPVP